MQENIKLFKRIIKFVHYKNELAVHYYYYSVYQIFYQLLSYLRVQ